MADVRSELRMGILAPQCSECDHQMIRDVRSQANDRKAVWYCPCPERHEEKS